MDWQSGEQLNLFGNFRVYTFTMIIGILASILSILYFWRKNKFPIEILLTLIIITIPFAIIGARLFWIIEAAINHNSQELSRWYAIWEGGLSIQGGVALPLVVNLLYLRRKRNVVDIRKAFGLIIPNILIGQAIGRWGNFANHELYGASMGDEIPGYLAWLGKGFWYNMYINGEYRVPLFLIESIISFVGWIIIVWIFLQFNYFKPGTTGGIYFVWYGITRVILEPLRDSNDYEIWYLSLAIVFIILGLLLIWYFESTGKKIYEKTKISAHSYVYINPKFKERTVNISSKWINQ